MQDSSDMMKRKLKLVAKAKVNVISKSRNYEHSLLSLCRYIQKVDELS